MGLKDDKKKSKSKKKHESSSSSSSPSSSSMSDSSSSSSSSSTSSCSAESSPEIAKQMTPPPRKADRCKIDVVRGHTPEIQETKTYDDFDVPSRDYDPNSYRRLESTVGKVEKNPKDSERLEKDSELIKKSYDKRDKENVEKKKFSQPHNNAEDSEQENSSRENKTESRRSRDEKRGSKGTHESRESRKNDDRKERVRSARDNDKESNKSPDRPYRQVSPNLEKEHRERKDENEDKNSRSKRKLDHREDSDNESSGRMDQSKRRKNSSDEKRDVADPQDIDSLGKMERYQGHSDEDVRKNNSDKRNEEKKDTEKRTERNAEKSDESRRTERNAERSDESRRTERNAERSDESRRTERNAERSDESRRTERNAERSDESRRNRGWSGKDSGEYDYRQKSPRNNSDWRRNRRSDDRYSSRRDYNDGNQRMIRRYWDNEPRDYESRRKREDDSEDEYVIGERFYGDESRKRDRRARETASSKDDKKDPTDEPPADPEKIPQSQKRTVDLLTSKTGGAYIPPAKLRMMQADITDKSGAAYQRIAWEALKKSIHGHINKVNTSNIGLITRELLRENIVRGRGLLARSIIQAQAASPTFTPVYAALTAVVNSKFPNIGELLLKRLVIQFRRGFRRSNKKLCISSGTFIAHLVNQRVAHEILALEFLTLLVETPTDDSIEVAISFLKECGMKLTEMSKKGIEAIFEMLRNILHEGQLDKRVQYMIEVMFQIRKDGFKDHPAVSEELDLVEEAQQYTHLITLDENMDSQDILNVFKFDPEYIANEEKYKQLSKEILDTDNSGSESEGDNAEDDSSDEESSDNQAEAKEGGVIVDNTETNLTALRRTIYLTIHSSLDFEECAHKLMKMQLKPGQEIELCHMFLDCCAEMRTYEKFFGLLAGRFCAINKIYVTPFEQIFRDSYDTIHRLDTNKLRNVSKFFAHLLFTDSISWEVLSCIKLNEEDTTSSSRIFIKILFQELSEYMGLSKLNQRVKDVTLQEAFDGLFPRDDPKNTRFAINFFTSIGLGGLTDDLREHLKSRPKPAVVSPVIKEPVKESSSSSSSSESSSSSDSSDSSSSSSSSSSSDGDRKKKKRKKKSAKPSMKSKSATRKSRAEKISSNESSHARDRRDRKESNDSRSKGSKKSERRR